MHADKLTRRDFLNGSGTSILGSAILGHPALGYGFGMPDSGMVVGQPAGERAGMQVLRDGGNAVDAVVAAALAAAVAAPHSAGIGGYGMSGVVAMAGGQKSMAIDGNTVAPAAISNTHFQQDGSGKRPPGLNPLNTLASVGWLSAGVPGILAGLQLALDQFGTRGFGELVQPAIAIARDGFPWPKGLAASIRNNKLLQSDPGSSKLYFPGGKPIAEGEMFRNPDLAAMLSTLAKANSVGAFYHGEIAQRIANGFQNNGGLVTLQDMQNYRAKWCEPLSMEWGASKIHTAPLTAGGASVLQMLMALQAMEWDKLAPGLMRNHARIEVMRLAWRDRLALLGDPDFTDVPLAKLLSKDYAVDSAERVMANVKAGTFLAHHVRSRPHTGTIHLNAADRHGNLAALTLTHGNGFGACVTVDGLGLTLGHGLSRFDPDPVHPNAPAPGKRPLHNMVPTIVTRNAEPVIAVGGTGGRKIPNGLFEVLTQSVVLGQPIAMAMAAPRIHTEGNASVSFEKTWPEAETDAIRKLGYSVITEGNANMSAIALESAGLVRAAR